MSYRRAHLGDAVSPGAQPGVVPPAGAQPAVQTRLPDGTRLTSALTSQLATHLATLPQQAAAARTNIQPPNIVPSWCSTLQPTSGTSDAIAAGQVGVLAFPLVKLTDAQVNATLQSVYGDGAGGPGLAAGVAAALAANIVR